MQARLLFTHALTPLHPGTGQGVGVIDLPIAREVATNIPYLPGSSLKGVLRDACPDPNLANRLFGTASGDNGEGGAAGRVQFTDQRLLLLPVRSLAGTFAWVTSPFVLQRFKRDIESMSDLNLGSNLAGLALSEKRRQSAYVPKLDSETSQTSLHIYQENKIVLEDIDLSTIEGEKTAEWGKWLATNLFPEGLDWQKTFLEHFCIVHDDIFSFLVETATEVIARNQLNEQTKASENLWYEEALPAESIIYGLILSKDEDDFDEIKKLVKNALQLGGNATIGRGLCQLTMVS